ncbi:MAG TPA: cystathionine beta-lyase [Candidatus Baltobacteraceae bacterium]|jgi:cystathionine beta-lyase|nr:cystathionine beta-lyase [Candidatus Baltobacteraceae bacterium]
MIDWRTKLIHAEPALPDAYRSLSTPVYRGSTTLFPSVAVAQDHWDQHRVGYTYGLYGTPTALELAARICDLESGMRTFLTPSGQAALALVNFALLRSGDHVLIPASIYKPHAWLATRMLSGFGIQTTFYEPGAGSGISKLFRRNTRLVWTESPGSVTMEVQDVRAIAEAARSAGAKVALDNTWSAGVLFDAFEHGVDVTMQALTKYAGGHGDLLMGSVTVADEDLYEKIGSAHQVAGYAVSPDDCSLVLRGLQTMGVRLEAARIAALEIAGWLSRRPEVERVLHPAFESCPGHEIWKRDFKGSSGVFSIVLRPGPDKERVHAFADALQLFEPGYSWAGTTSLVMTYDLAGEDGRPAYDHRLVRLSIGLESPADLIADLERAFAVLAS